MTRVSITSTVLAAGLIAAALLAGCGGDDMAATPGRAPARRTAVTDDGTAITFAAGSPGLLQLSSTVVRKRTATIPVIAPARVVAAVVPGSAAGERLVLFDSPDVTSLYSQYRQAVANAARADKNLTRVRDMFQNQAATAKDIADGENDAATARAAKAEAEGKLRGLGFDPAEFDRVRPGTAWLMCDVTESQLGDVQKGEDVPVRLAAFPDARFHGRADAVGEVIDPVSRTVKVRVSMPNPGGHVFPGMFARVDFGDPISGVVLLPASAIVTVEGSDYAFVQTSDSSFARRQVTLGSSGSQEVIVLKGLGDGERVVTAGAMLLKGLSFGY